MKFYTIAEAMYDGLQQAGHRPFSTPCETRWDPRESKIDFWLIGISPLDSMASRYAIGAYKLLDECRRYKIPHAMFVDDWFISGILKGLRRMTGEIERTKRNLAMMREYWHERDISYAMKRVTYYNEVFGHMRYEPWPLTVGPFYAWGDRAKAARLSNITQLLALDPNIMDKRYPEDPNRSKQRKIIMASLPKMCHDWLKKQENVFPWPIISLGSRAYKQPRLKENRVIELYSRVWGILSPPYYQAGSGWARPRFALAARAHAILIATEAEVEALGGPYMTVARDPMRLKRMSDDELRELAKEQRIYLRKSAATREQFIETMDRLVNGRLRDGEIWRRKNIG